MSTAPPPPIVKNIGTEGYFSFPYELIRGNLLLLASHKKEDECEGFHKDVWF